MAKTSFAFASLALAFAGCNPVFSSEAQAASSTSSAVSESVGVSLAGISGSLTTSSNSSSTKDVAQGEYRIVDVAAAPADTRPGLVAHVRLTLQRELPAGQAPGAHDTLFLTLPQTTFDGTGLGRDQRVAATQRSYGIEFARADTKQAFFLVLEDHWLQELASRPVVL